MAKCVCPPTGKSGKGSSGKGGKQVKNKNASQGKKAKGGKKRVPNMFILYFLEMYKKHGGNMYCVAKECGKRWKSLPQSEKDRYKRQYCARCKSCKSCTRTAKPGGSSGGDSTKTGGGKGC